MDSGRGASFASKFWAKRSLFLSSWRWKEWSSVSTSSIRQPHTQCFIADHNFLDDVRTPNLFYTQHRDRNWGEKVRDKNVTSSILNLKQMAGIWLYDWSHLHILYRFTKHTQCCKTICQWFIVIFGTFQNTNRIVLNLCTLKCSLYNAAGRFLGTYFRKLLDMIRISTLFDWLNMLSGRPASVSLLLCRYTDLLGDHAIILKAILQYNTIQYNTKVYVFCS